MADEAGTDVPLGCCGTAAIAVATPTTTGTTATFGFPGSGVGFDAKGREVRRSREIVLFARHEHESRGWGVSRRAGTFVHPTNPGPRVQRKEGEHELCRGR